MRIHSIGDFARGWEQPLPPCAAVAIAPSSDVDLCSIGGHVLAPGAVVPYAPTVIPVRGYRTDDDPIATGLVLVLYDECDAWLPPGPRTARVYQGSGGGPDPQRVLRVPFSGRKQAAISIQRASALEEPAIVQTVRGVRYWSREAIRGGLVLPPVCTEVASSVVFEASTLDAADLGAMVYVGGGGDSQESFDELELWYHDAGSSGLVVQAEVSGERG